MAVIFVIKEVAMATVWPAKAILLQLYGLRIQKRDLKFLKILKLELRSGM